MSLPLNQVITGDCTEVMREWPENSVDCIVTDPPYGLSFMGKDWDKTLPPREAFDEIIRVLKPGALAFVMSSPRQDVLWRMLAMLEGVGFELRQSALFWIYRTGFPKAFDVSKGVDRKYIYQKYGNVIREFLREAKEKSSLTSSEIDKELGLKGGNFSQHFIGNNPQFRLPTKEQWFKLKEILSFEDGFDSLYNELRNGKERPNIGKGDSPISWGTTNQIHEGGFKPDYDLTEPASDLGKKWEGWKSQTGLKPAVEMVLMVNKPRSESTIVDNVLKWGTGAINVDACRIPFETTENPATNPLYRQQEDYKNKSAPDIKSSSFQIKNNEVERNINPQGRFPSNLIISDGALDTGETTKSGKFESHHKIAKDENGHSVKNVYGKYRHLPADQQVFYGDEGSPFRFFDLDAWAEHHGFLDVAKPSKAERDFGLTTQPLKIPKSKFNLSDGSKNMRFDGVIPTPRRNIHPTVKPVKLMAYLIELGCPPDGVVVDPFVGSGTTCIAAKQLRRKWIGIEINPEYAEIADARINIRGPLDQFMEAEE